MVIHYSSLNKDSVETGRKTFGVYFGIPGGSDGKESTCNAEDLGSIPELERSPGGGQGKPFQYFCLEKPHGQRSLAGYTPWGHKELDATEQLSTAQRTTTVPCPS